jgi:uncharacterized protein (DUF58 family)
MKRLVSSARLPRVRVGPLVVRALLYGLMLWNLDRVGLPLAVVGILCVELVLRRGRVKRRANLRFTREGRYLVAITLGVGFAAINTGNNLLYLFLGMLLSMIIVSGVLSEQTLRGLRVTRQIPRQVHAGRPFLTGITLGNDKRRLPSFSVQVEDLVEGRPAAKKCYFLKVPAGARQQTSYRTEFSRRGRYRYEALQLGTRFPFAFFIKTRQVAAPAELLVLPRLLPLGHLPLEAQALLGALSRPRRGDGREFHGLRDYRAGDDARDIHWKRSAREARLVLREYEAEGSRRVVVLLNDQRPATPADPEALEKELDDCVDLAASLLVHFAERGFTAELRLSEARLPVHPDGRGLQVALRRLALLEFIEADTPLPAPSRRDGHWLLVTHRRAARPGGRGHYSHVFEQGA